MDGTTIHNPKIGRELRRDVILCRLKGGRSSNHVKVVFVGVSVFVKPAHAKYEQAEDLIRDADIAMYRAKNQGSNSYKFFDAAMHTQALQRLTLEADLRHAIQQQDFVVTI